MDLELQEYITARISVDKTTGCWNWLQYKNKDGYGQVRGEWYKKYGKCRSHQLSYIAFNGIYPKELHVLHKCHNRECCNPQHLYLGTHKENMRDKSADRRISGELNPNSKLTNDQVLVIKSLFPIMKQKDIAAMFNVNPSTISNIKADRRWRK